MKVLIVTAMYPKPENPAYGSFIRTQVESLRRAHGFDTDMKHVAIFGRCASCTAKAKDKAEANDA